MTIGKVQLEARCLYSPPFSTTAHLLDPAAFLTQTVNLDDGTSVKFEIWCAYSVKQSTSCRRSHSPQGHCWSGTLQGLFTFVASTKGH
jgi:hypothetical protein